jgi:SAM-dependent methyltransferase
LVTRKRILNILRYGIGDEARRRKRAVKDRVRQERFQSELWREKNGVTTRKYASYDEYLAHQSAKLEKVAHRLRETMEEDLAEFIARFRGCLPLKEARNVLCLGARLGTEVRALHEMGYFAVGIDLNPGERNAFVLPGDFHDVVFPSGSVDAVYTNSLDHAFDLERICLEVRRLLRPGGLFVIDVLAGYEEGFTPGTYEATHWRSAAALIEKIREIGAFDLVEVRDLGRHRRDAWSQTVLRKPQ